MGVIDGSYIVHMLPVMSCEDFAMRKSEKGADPAWRFPMGRVKARNSLDDGNTQ